MFINLTTHVAPDSPLIQWANSQDNRHVAMGHVGTHLDTYEKSALPMDYFKSTGILFDVRGIQEVSLSDITLADIPKNGFVLFRTGQMEAHSYGAPAYFQNHPHLSDALIEHLLAQKIRFIGLDCAGIRPHAQHEPADRLCEKNGTYVIENLSHLHELPAAPLTIYTTWQDDDTMTGLKCSVIAELPTSF